MKFFILILLLLLVKAQDQYYRDVYKINIVISSIFESLYYVSNIEETSIDFAINHHFKIESALILN